MSRIGVKLKQLRNEAGFSQKQLGKKLGVSETFINEVETGKKIINQNLIDRISKILGKDLNDLTMSFEEEVYKEEQKFSYEPKKQKTNDVWNEAFGSVLKSICIYKYDLNKPIGNKQLPIVSNKIEGYPQDKVFYIEVENDDMTGFRICKGDLAFAHIIHEIENNAICLIEYKGERKIRQIKKLDNNKVLLVSNSGSLLTETVEIKNIKAIAKLDKLEIKL
ncbi:helix-turn-helix domain-containing protein [Clostridium rectalis]|uniref:helix-turn-helix domain-containing protein n=1 Tax=Clostridium rectalis TaxID=2040295 RepID=UPI000F63D9FB|nr:helix-turn-helix transcriptional regulator [Clostridium rectalis]